MGREQQELGAISRQAVGLLMEQETVECLGDLQSSWGVMAASDFLQVPR